MKTLILSVTTLTVLTLFIFSSCQTNRSYDPRCPCNIERNPVTAKDAYYQNYYQSEPVR